MFYDIVWENGRHELIISNTRKDQFPFLSDVFDIGDEVEGVVRSAGEHNILCIVLHKTCRKKVKNEQNNSMSLRKTNKRTT